MDAEHKEEEVMEIQIQATVGVCAEFLRPPAQEWEKPEKAEVSVVIAPLKVTSQDEGKIQVITGCNMWRSCHNPDCWYSIASRQAKKT